MNEGRRSISPTFAIGIALLVIGIGALSVGNTLGSRTIIIAGFIFLFIGYIRRGR